MRQLFFIITLMMSITTFAQTSDEGRISIQAMMPDDVIPMEASKNQPHVCNVCFLVMAMATMAM